MTTTAAEPWTLDHRLHMFNQFETRPGPPDSEGRSWIQRQLTGKVNAVCNCGFTTGWVPRDQLPDYADLLAEHPGHPQGMDRYPDQLKATRPSHLDQAE